MNVFKNKELIRIFLFIGCFCLVLGILRFVFYPALFSESNFLNWDAKHYDYIRKNGYAGFRIAFFPLFPMLWKIFGFNVFGILFFNAVIYFTAFYVLIKSMILKSYETILYLSIPSSIFYFLPYSEAVFFACSVLLLVGIKKERTAYVLVGLLMCTLARPSFTILIPALLIMEYFGNESKKLFLKNSLLYILITVLGVGLVGLIQYKETGEWFQFFAVQKGWGNYLQVPHFPLRSWGGNMIVRLDGVCLLFGLASGIVLILYFFKSRFFLSIKLPKEILLSLAFIAGITASVLLFRGGSLFSLNRFVFASPFIIVVVNYYLKCDFSFTVKQLAFALLILIIYWLSFASYVHIQAFLKFFAVSLYILLFLGLKSNNRLISKFSAICFITVNFIFLLVFYLHFLLTEGDVGFVG